MCYVTSYGVLSYLDKGGLYLRGFVRGGYVRPLLKISNVPYICCLFIYSFLSLYDDE